MTIENSHHSTPTEAERRARNLEAVLRVSKTIASSLDLDHTLSATCQAAVELLGVSHSSLVLLSRDRDRGKVQAEYPEFGVRGLIIQLSGMNSHKLMGTSTETIFIPDVKNASELGTIRKHLLRLNIQSILIVPVVSEHQVLGHFSLDTVGDTRSYTDEEIELCKIFAAQAAVAIKNAQLYQETKQRAEQLEALRQTTLAVTSRLDLDGLLREIIEQAAALLKAKNGGIFKYYPGRDALMVIVDSSPEGRKKGVILRAGEGMAGRLLQSTEPYMIVDNYEQWPGRARVDEGRRPKGAVLEVKIIWQKHLIGTLYVEDDVPRKFTDEDARLLMLFADQAAIAMHNAQLVEDVREGQQIITTHRRATRDNLESLSQAVQTLSGKLDPQQVLMMTAEQARKSLGGDSATIWPYDNGLDKFLPADLVTVGIPEEALEEFRGQTPPTGGISRAVMRVGWLYVEDVETEAPKLEFMRNTPRTELLLKMGIRSFQGAALYVSKKPVGVLYVNYNRLRVITEEDRASMEAMAELAALVLMIVRSAQLSEARKQTLQEQEALVELSKQLLGTVGREQILNCAVAVARSVLNTDCCNVVLPDKEGRLLFVAQEGWENVEVGKTEMGRGRHSQTGYIIEKGKPSRVADYDKQHEFIPPEEIKQNRLKSGMGVPMFRESEVIGAMLVHSRKHRIFTDAEENLLSLIANQTAIALNSAEQIKRQRDYLSALLNASTAISKSGLDRTLILNQIVEQAYRCLISAGEQKTTLSTLQLYDPANHTLSFASAYPPEQLQELKATFGDKRRISREPGSTIGIVGRTLLEKKPQLVANVHEDPDYYTFLPGTQSELAVPLVEGAEVRGVLNVESNQPAAFDTLHVKELEAVAEIAVIAIQNAEQFEELENTRMAAEASSAIALMGMASSVWAHSIRTHARNILGLIDAMYRKLTLSDDQMPVALLEEFSEKFARLERQALKILEKPLADPLLSEHGVGNFSVREVLEESLAHLRRNEAYGTVTVESRLEAVEASVQVRCNPEWLKRTLDILFDNAVKAMKGIEPARRLLLVGTNVVSDGGTGEVVEITVADSGPGIPPEMRNKVLKRRIESGSGVGLLMARTIVEAYGGRIELKSTGGEGTTMIIRLPVSGI